MPQDISAKDLVLTSRQACKKEPAMCELRVVVVIMLLHVRRRRKQA